MAKLTAKFDMEDRLSKKLRGLHGNLQSLERSRNRINKPMTLKVRDNATKSLQKINRFVKKDIAKTHNMVLSVNDKATKSLRAISRYTERKMPKTYSLVVSVNDKAMKSLESVNNYLKRRMPKSYEVVLRARDRTRSVMQNIRGFMIGNILGTHMFTIMARDRATPTMHKIANYTRRSLQKGYNFTVRAIDIATKTVGRIASFTKSAIPKYRDFTIRAINQASTVISTVKRALFSIPTVLTVTLAVVGAGSLGKSTIGAAMDFEDYRVSMTHWLKGNQKQSDQLIDWMGRFADSTPFSSADLFPALSRGVGITEGDVKQAKDLLRISADMAGLMPGKTVSDAMEALADARMGEFERMKEFNMKITAEDYEEMGWSGFVKQVNDTFAGGAEALSDTGRGQLNTLLGYSSTQFRSIGEGILDSMKPRLQAVNDWLDNNQDKWAEWKKTLEDAGSEGAEWVFSKLEGAFSYIRDNYLENDNFKNLDFEGKVKFIMDDLGGWWDKTGRPLLVEVSKEVGEAIFKGVTWGIKEGLKSIGTMWVDAFKNPSVESFAGAGIATALAGSLATIVLAPLIKGIGGIYKAGKWFWDRGKDVANFFGKGRGKGPKTPVPPVTGGSGKTPNTTGQPKGGFFANLFGKKGKAPVYTNPWFDKGTQATLNTPNAFKNVKEVGKLAKFGKGLGAVAKRVPVLSTLLGVGTIMAAPEGQKGQAVGNVGGGLGGAAIGATIGSVIPGFGTAIGGLAGGIIGSIGGGKAGAWLDENWETIKQKASDAAESVGNAFNTAKEGISSTLFDGEWWSGKWNDSVAWAEDKWGNLTEGWSSFKDTIGSTVFDADWWAEKVGFAIGWAEGKWENVTESWNQFKETIGETIFNSDWWATKWDGAVAWAEEKFGPLVETWNQFKETVGSTIFSGDWWKEKWTGAVAWGSEKWSGVVETWDNFKESVGSTIFNGDWWKDKWDGAVAWGASKWSDLAETWDNFKESVGSTIFNSEWWQGKWQDAAEWGSEKWNSIQNTWEGFKTKIGDTLFDKDWWQGKWSNAVEWGKGIWGDVKDWFGGLGESYSKGKERGKEAAAQYARGGLITRPHLGLVGEAGPEMIIPLSQNRRGRAMDLYNKTGQMLGVQPYANGGLVGGSVKQGGSNAQSAVIAASISVNQVSTQGIDKKASEYGESFSQSVAEGINGNVISLDNWKKTNIQQPMSNVMKEAVGFGTGTVNSFASGQNATRTNTNAHLNKEVRTPFQAIEGGASSWGSTTVNNFRSGQDSSNTGTKPYLATNVHAPFDETKAKGSVWGSGTISEFVAGMRSEGSKVAEAAKHLAEMVEKTFKEELGIKSPSRVMMRLGEFASLGIVKGLGKVDVKKFAEGQAGSLAAAFSGMASIGGSIQSWLQAAMAITGVPSSWLGPLGVIAQRESGGNPRAINLWDINAQRGIPSKGLMQTIDPTFNAYKMAGLNDIWNPIHNAVAAIRYIQSRYGTVFNTPGIRSMMSGGAYKGYWRGTNGPLNRAETAWVGERGPELVRLPRGAEVYSHQESMDMVNQTVPAEQMATVVYPTRRAKSSKSSSKEVNININGDNHFHNDMDVDTFAERVLSVVEKALEDEYTEGGEMVVYD